MSELETQYLEFEKEVAWPKAPGSDDLGDQYYALTMDLGRKVRKRSLAEGLDLVGYEARVSRLLDMVGGLRYALNRYPDTTPLKSRNQQCVWYHRSPEQVASFTKRENEPYINRELLLDVAAAYLANSWLQHDFIDWAIVDALIFSEASAYSEGLYSGQSLGRIDWRYVLSGEDLGKYVQRKIWAGIVTWVVLFFVAPTMVAALFLFDHGSAAALAGTAYAVGVPLYFLRKRREAKALEKPLDRLEKMISAYFTGSRQSSA